ncbi:MAG TPA: DUF563 domain-containing protein, partial [Chromatiaceae bacterium]|nr:DUF563 domain-containing protein [Chromatiaceae bacterium]
MTPPLLRIIPESARKEWLSHEWHGEIATFVLPPRELVSVPRATATPGRQCSPEEAEAGIYDARGRLVAASLHQRRNKYFTAATPWELIQPRNAPILHGRHLYLGWFFDHYGHFILESLSRCWALAEAGSVDGYLFHRPETHRKAPAQLLRLLELLGIPQEKVRFIDSTTRFEELLVPSQQAVLARGISRETLDLYTRMAFRAWKQGGERRHNRSLYLSRRFLGSDMRQAANEWMLERSFRNEGYQVLHPHYMDGIDQLSIYYKAKRFAGLDGSGLHNILFAEAPEEMWILGTENRLADSITQVELNRLKGCRTTLLLQSVTRSGRLPPQLTPFLVQPSSRLPAFEPTPLDRFNWLSQLASRLSRNGCNNADCAALEPEPEVDERWVLQALLGSPIARDKPAPGTEEEQLSALLSVHRQLAAGKVGEAAEELERLLPAYRQHPEFLAFYTGVLRKKGDHEKALEMAAHALLLDPDNPRLLLLQA